MQNTYSTNSVQKHAGLDKKMACIADLNIFGFNARTMKNRSIIEKKCF